MRRIIFPLEGNPRINHTRNCQRHGAHHHMLEKQQFIDMLRNFWPKVGASKPYMSKLLLAEPAWHPDPRFFKLPCSVFFQMKTTLPRQTLMNQVTVGKKKKIYIYVCLVWELSVQDYFQHPASGSFPYFFFFFNWLLLMAPPHPAIKTWLAR